MIFEGAYLATLFMTGNANVTLEKLKAVLHKNRITFDRICKILISICPEEKNTFKMGTFR